jgi:NAD(P)-dependent dehydrogenase (short-subunit alcohol dehydrogenase family)
MSSCQGSVANNERGGHEVYRGSKAALNTFMRSYAARHRDGQRSLVLMAPGWVRTELGGPDARLSIDDSIPNVVKTLDALRGIPGATADAILRRPPQAIGTLRAEELRQLIQLLERLIDADEPDDSSHE